MMTIGAMRKLFSILFLIAVFGASAYNLNRQWSAIARDMVKLTVPGMIAEAQAGVSAVENSVNSNITGKYDFIDAYAWIQLLMGKREVSDFKHIKAENGALNYGNAFPIDTSMIPEYAARVGRLRDAVTASGGKLLYLNPPDLIVKREPQYVRGMPYQDFNPSQDVFLDCLRELGVDFLDSRPVFTTSGFPLDKVLFKTDHHWTVEACFLVFIALVDEMEKLYGVTLDEGGAYRDIGNYNIRIYPDSFLGSLGRATGAVFSGLEDFTLIWPRFTNRYRVEKVDPWFGAGVSEGLADETLLYKPGLEVRDPYSMNMYNTYLGGTMAWMRITNEDNPGRPRLLLIHDSFSMPLACFLAPLFGEIHMIWPLSENYRPDIEKYVAENSFDYVVVELSPGNYSEEGFGFFVDRGELEESEKEMD